MPQTMKIILQEDVDNLGQVGEVVTVRSGYARNFLLPEKKAMMASEASVRHLEHLKRLTEKKKAQLRDVSMGVAKKLAEVTVTITAKVGDQGKLFGSITARDIAADLSKQGFAVTAKGVKITEPIKTIGTHKVDVRLQAGVMAQVKVWVVAENIAAVTEGAAVEAKPAAAPAAAAPTA